MDFDRFPIRFEDASGVAFDVIRPFGDLGSRATK